MFLCNEFSYVVRGYRIEKKGKTLGELTMRGAVTRGLYSPSSLSTIDNVRCADEKKKFLALEKPVFAIISLFTAD